MDTMGLMHAGSACSMRSDSGTSPKIGASGGVETDNSQSLGH